MKHEADILNDDSIRTNPFRMPDGYVLLLEENVQRRIASKNSPAVLFWSKVKAPVMLAVTFALIFGMGYGVMSLTGTSSPSSSIRSNEVADILDDYTLHSSFIEDYYEEMATNDFLDVSANDVEITDEMESEIISYITMNDIMTY
ncbi:MAG: hypothetical protein KBS57_05995 [Alistipes sp.]|nr:hypothetical protein [Candidatus Minthomonas equi]